MGKLKNNVMGKNGKPMSAEEREDKICYYRDLFWLTFRVFDEDEIDETEDGYDDVDFFNSVDEEDVKYFEDRFSALNALDVFYKLYYDYCNEQLAVLKKNMIKITESALELDDKKEGMKKKFVMKLQKIQTGRVESNLQAQERLKTIMKELKTEMVEIGMLQPAIKAPAKKKKAKATIKGKTKLKGKKDSIDKILESIDPKAK